MSYTTEETLHFNFLVICGKPGFERAEMKRHLCDRTGKTFSQCSLERDKGSKTTTSLRLVKPKTATDRQKATGLLGFVIVPWNGVVFARVSFDKEKTMRYPLVFSNSLIKRVAPL